jgi:Amidase
MNSIRAAESRVAERIQSIFDDVDVLVTPGTAIGPSRIGAYQRRGAISTVLLVAARVPFQTLFNVTGQPAAVVPWGLDGDGIPTSIQLVGRPFDEATLLSLGADRESAAMGGAPPTGLLKTVEIRFRYATGGFACHKSVLVAVMPSPRPTPCAPRNQVRWPFFGSDLDGLDTQHRRLAPAPAAPVAVAARSLSARGAGRWVWRRVCR